MPDFALCHDQGCPSRKKCLRATAKPSQRQTYAWFDRPKDAERCDSFICGCDGREKPATVTVSASTPRLRPVKRTAPARLVELLREVVSIAAERCPDITLDHVVGCEIHQSPVVATRTAFVYIARARMSYSFPDIAAAIHRGSHSWVYDAYLRYTKARMHPTSFVFAREIVETYDRRNTGGICEEAKGEADRQATGNPSGADGADRRDPRGPAAEDAA